MNYLVAAQIYIKDNPLADALMGKFENKIIEHQRYIQIEGVDPLEVAAWKRRT